MWDCFEINPKTFFIWRLCLVISKNNNSGMKFHYSDVSLIEKLTLDEPTNLTTAYNMSHKIYAKKLKIIAQDMLKPVFHKQFK